jgi:hypothetical protein
VILSAVKQYRVDQTCLLLVSELHLSPEDHNVLRAVAYKLKHHLTVQAFEDARKAFPHEDLPSWKSAQTRLNEVSGLTPFLYDCCVNSCCCFTGPHESKKSCPYCDEPRFNAHGHPRKRFSYIPLIPRLKAFLANQEMAQQMLYRSQEFEYDLDMVKDVFDGSHYRSLLGKRVVVNDHKLQHCFFDGCRDIALGLSTDGYAPFKRRAKTAWPLVIYNYNLPPDIRFQAENVLRLGVIPGPKKPVDFDSFIWPLVHELLMLEVGVESWDAVGKTMFPLRAYLILVFGDIPAISMVMRMKGHNGVCPCRACEITGVRVPGVERSPLYVPLDRSRHPESKAARAIKKFDPLDLPLREHNRFMEQAREVQMADTVKDSNDLSRQYGIKGIPLLSHLSSLSFPASFPYDFMHLIWENVVKNLFELWTGNHKGLDTGKGDYKISPEDFKEIGKLSEEAGCTIPYTFGPRPPDVSADSVPWTADLRSFWTMNMAPQLLKNRLKAPYYTHFLDLVRLLSMCLEFEMDREKIHILRTSFAKWVQDYERYVF